MNLRLVNICFFTSSDVRIPFCIKVDSSFNNLRSSAYGYTSKGAAMANTFRGSYAAPSEIRRSQCGGKRRRKSRRRRR